MSFFGICLNTPVTTCMRLLVISAKYPNTSLSSWQAHERPEGMDEGTLIMCRLKKGSVLEAIDVVRSHFIEGDRTFRTVQDYDVENVSKKVLRIILSYTDYVNRTVWHRY